MRGCAYRRGINRKLALDNFRATSCNYDVILSFIERLTHFTEVVLRVCDQRLQDDLVIVNRVRLSSFSFGNRR